MLILLHHERLMDDPGGERVYARASGGMRTPRCQPVPHGAGGVSPAPWGAALAAYYLPDIALA